MTVMDVTLFKKLGFSDKDMEVYLALLRLGPSSVRKLAEMSQLNRGTVYESLKWLQNEGLVDLYEKQSKQLFVAENPTRLQDMVTERAGDLKEAEKKVREAIPELQSIYDRGGDQPVARYFGPEEIGKILEDVLKVCEEQHESVYRVYSAAGVREHLYEQFPSFSDARIAKNITVRVIALGEGGELRGLDERKWLSVTTAVPTFIIIFPGKTAYISLDAKHEPVGVVIENRGVYETQKAIFDHVWGVS